MRYIAISVRGRVQGVGFRYFTQHTATDCNITGWVKNEADGSVYIEAYGGDENIDLFLDKIKKGPSRFAKVSDLSVKEYAEDPEFTSFDIKY
ncbi:acylphosphatase [Oceanobacillus sp. J11TS1]|uniref:acylphosphatase n=1 Tax=Oceanobacillus sp. J11TS1 TaxID=2807191 RepID=UPI001B13A49E|nr:acylphosphatase [Oceanobacillus sp. J11TS1]GIO22674.1 acylphosphatase [Oceanobacillus sp. J11TS1]